MQNDQMTNTIVQKYDLFFLKKLILLFSKDALN